MEEHFIAAGCCSKMNALSLFIINKIISNIAFGVAKRTFACTVSHFVVIHFDEMIGASNASLFSEFFTTAKQYILWSIHEQSF